MASAIFGIDAIAVVVVVVAVAASTESQANDDDEDDERIEYETMPPPLAISAFVLDPIIARQTRSQVQ